MPLSDLHVFNVCLAGQIGVCKYLQSDELELGVFQCAKLSNQKDIVDEMVKKDNLKLIQKGLDPRDQDNCAGYPILRYKKVGYDQKSI
jgi:hypothetical protein